VVPVLAVVRFAAEARRPRNSPAITRPGTLFCRNEYVIHTYLYAATCILAHGSPDLMHDRHVAFSAVLIGNQIAESRAGGRTYRPRSQ